MELSIYLGFRSIGVSEDGAARIARVSHQFVNWAVRRAWERTGDWLEAPALARTLVNELVPAGIALPTATRFAETMERCILQETERRAAAARTDPAPAPLASLASRPEEASRPPRR